MPIPKDQQKNIVIPKEYKVLLDNYLKTATEATGKSGSSILVNHLFNDMLPANSNGRELFKSLYTDSTIKEVLTRLFQMNAEFLWPSESIRPFVDFAQDMILINHWRNRGGEYNNKCLDYLLSNLSSLTDILQKKYDEDITLQLSDTIWHLKDHIRLTKANIEEFLMSYYVHEIKEYWEFWKNSPCTYRALYAVLETEYDWSVTDEERYKLGELLRKHSPAGVN